MNLIEELDRANLNPVLREILRAKLAQIDSLTQEIKSVAQENESLTNTVREQKQLIEALKFELAHLRRIRFGVKSEAMTAAQLQLFDETCVEDEEEIVATIETVAKASPAQSKPAVPQRSRAGRQALPDHLPREVHVHEPPSCQCGKCGSELVKIGEDVTEQLDVIPAKFFVRRHIYPKYVCRQCETIESAPRQPSVIDGGLAAPGLLTWLLIGKYADHLPLYRLEQIAARAQVPLARSTLAEWVGRLGFALMPLANRLAELLKERKVLHADETPVAQLDPGSGKTKRAYLWAWRSNDLDPGPPILVFDYQTSRAGIHAASFLENWSGHLMVDDYAGYKQLFTQSQITELACWAHARRKFFDLHSANKSPMAAEALRRIGELYALEAEVRNASPEARLEQRREARKKLADFHDWLLRTRQTTAPGSGAAKALDYTLERWPALIRYAETGNLPIDNNPVENAIRPIALGKKNWLFAGSERAGKRAAAIQTLLGTARLNGLDPQSWLRDTLEKLPAWPHRRIDELLPLRGNHSPP